MGLAELMADAGAAAAPAEEKDLGAPEAKASPEEEDLGVEEGDDGKKSVPIAEVHRTRAKAREAKERAERAEAEFKAYREKNEGRSKLVDEIYGKLPDPEAQMREDAQIGEALWNLRERPEVKAVLALIQQQKGAVKVSERSEKPAAEPQADPMVAELVRERTRDAVDKVLDEYGVRAQLRKPISDYVLAQKGLKPTREAALTAIREYVTANEWTKEFLRGDGKKPKPAVLPNPGGLNGGSSPKKDGEKAAAPDKPKNLSQLQAQQRSKFTSLMEQHRS